MLQICPIVRESPVHSPFQVIPQFDRMFLGDKLSCFLSNMSFFNKIIPQMFYLGLIRP